MIINWFYKEAAKGLCKKARYDFICHNGISQKNFSTDYEHIKAEKTRGQYIHRKYVVMKMIIFKIKETNTVTDYRFHRLFYDVVVPTLCEKGSVILIQGEGVNEKLIDFVEFTDDKIASVCFLRLGRNKT